MSTALATIDKITAAELFKPGASKTIIDKVEEEARALAATFDVSTPAGEDGLRTVAAHLGRTKQKIDKARIELVSDEKKRLKVIDAEGGVIWDRMEALQKEVRQPLTDKEEAEKKRVFDHEANLAELVGAGNHAAQNWQNLSVEALRDRLKEITNSKYDWQEFLGRAKVACVDSIAQIKEAIQRREKMDADAAELDALRAAQAKRAQEEREAAIAQAAKDAADAAARKREEEQRAAAEAERQRIENERVEAEARAKQAEAQREQERVAAEEALAAAQEQARLAAERAERDRIAFEAAEKRRAEIAEGQRREREAQHARDLQEQQEKAELEARVAEERREREAKEAVERARQVRLQAIIAERERADAEHRKELAAADARENNRKHAAKINGEVRDAIMKAVSDASIVDLTEIQATAIVVSIAKGLIPHTKISY